VDAPLPIGFGVTNSQPTTVANMLSLLDPLPGNRVLDVGAGSGWTTALLAHLVGPDGLVLGTERIPELVARASEAIAEWAQASVRLAVPGVLGYPERAPYDRILVSAMAEELPDELVEQLGPGGVLVIPVSGVMLRVVRGADGDMDVTRHGWYSFVPLIR
jgi:protein-L-isoaspartate(D-aspartate) O-methyltransferase